MNLVKYCPLLTSKNPSKESGTTSVNSMDFPKIGTSTSNDACKGDHDNNSYSCSSRMDTCTRVSYGSSIDNANGTNLLDDALTAAMEAIADANRFNATHSPDLIMDHPPIVSLNSSFESVDKLEPDLELRPDKLFPHDSIDFDFDKDLDYATEQDQADHPVRGLSEPHNEKPHERQQKEDSHSTDLCQLFPVNTPSSTMSSFYNNWRPILRPLFERTLIERLWSSGELGATGPQPLLLAIWFIISRNFRIGCRTEHAKLVYGNVDIGTDPVTGRKQLQYFRTVRSLVDTEPPNSESAISYRSPEPDIVVPEQPDKSDRCPVWLFQRFRDHRPFTVNFPICPLYLQPERHATLNTPLIGTNNDIIWYTTNGLGKNKIGAMLNSALQNVGIPIGRQINLTRFCDALAAAALTPAGGEAGARLAELVKVCQQEKDQEQVRKEMESCAESIVNESTTSESPINRLLLSMCSTKEKPKAQPRAPPKICPKTRTNHDRTGGGGFGSSRVGIHPIRAGEVKPSNSASDDSSTTVKEQPQAKNGWPHNYFAQCTLQQTNTTNFPTDLLLRCATDVVATSVSQLAPSMVPSVSGTRCLPSQSGTVVDAPNAFRLISSVPMDENVMKISPLSNLNYLAPSNLSSAATRLSEVVPMRENQLSNTTSTSHPQQISEDQPILPANDDIYVETPKLGTPPCKPIRLELRDLLELVMASAKKASIDSPDRVHNEMRRLQVVNTVQRPPVGLVTQLLWRSRALDDRGPWILTFSMWWLMQHYFGIGTRVHHVRLCWGHLRLVSGVRDPMTGELCEALEYVGPPEFTTLRACALVESCGDSLRVRRVYPSSGWAEAEITIAGALCSADASDRPRVRPLETTADVPTVPARTGPNFVELYKAFARHRQQPSLNPEAPFYLQPLQAFPKLLNRSDVVWYSVGGLGKNRVGALMRNIVDKVVRPNLSRIAQAAINTARNACIVASQQAVQALPSSALGSPQELQKHRQFMLNKLSCILGLSLATDTGQPPVYNTASSLTSQTQPHVIKFPVQPATFTNTNVANSTIRLLNPQPSSSIPSNNSNGAISVRELTLGLARGSLPQAVPQNTSFTLSDLQQQLIRRPAASNLLWNSSSVQPCTSSPTTSLVLITSPDGSSTQLAAIQPQPQQQQSFTNRMFLVPTASGNTALVAGSTLAVHPDNNVTDRTIQRHPQQSLIQSAQQATVLSSVESQLIKTHNTLNSTSRTGQSVAYLTQPQTSSNNSPVRLVLLPVSNDDTQQTAPSLQSSFLIGGVSENRPQLVSYCQPIKLEDTAPIVTIPPVTRLQTIASATNQSSGRFLFDAGTSKLITYSDRLGTSGPSTTSVPLHLPLSTSVSQGSTTALTAEYPVQSFKPEQVSPTGSMYNSPPIIIQAITPDGQVFNLSHAPQMTPTEDIKPHLYDEFYEDPNPDETTAGELLSTFTPQTIANGSIPYIQEAIPFSDAADQSLHGVFPTSSIACRVVGSSSSEAPLQPVVAHSESRPCSTQSSSSLVTTHSEPTSQVALTTSSTQSSNVVKKVFAKAQPSNIALPLLSEIAYNQPIPEPAPGQLRTLQAAIDSAYAFQCCDFPSYAEKLFRRGILSANQPFLLNFCAWFINSVAFEVENRTHHANLRWGDFRLGQTADGNTEFIYFVHPYKNKAYYLAASPDSSYQLGVNEDLAPLRTDPLPVRCPCPVAIFKALRNHRPLSCQYLHAKFYLQPVTRQELANACTRRKTSPDLLVWFTERPWGKNKLGSLFAEAARLAGLPAIYMRNRRSNVPSVPGVSSTVSNTSSAQLPTTSSFGDPAPEAELSNGLPPLDAPVSGSDESLQTELKRRRMSHSPDSEHANRSPTASGIVSLPSSSTILRPNKPASVS